MAKKKTPKNQAARLQIYLWSNIEADRFILSLWNAAQKHSRAQPMFREILTRGIKAMMATGDMPADIMLDEEVVFHIERAKSAKESVRGFVDDLAIKSALALEAPVRDANRPVVPRRSSIEHTEPEALPSPDRPPARLAAAEHRAEPDAANPTKEKESVLHLLGLMNPSQSS